MHSFLFRNIANIITGSRIFFAILMLTCKPFSVLFWLCYACASLSDMVDGYVARKLGQQSAFGAKLDSIADAFFAISIVLVLILYVSIPWALWCFVMVIAMIRLGGYFVGYIRFREFATIHTYANKFTGFAIVVSPIMYPLFGFVNTSIVLCFIAFYSAMEETILLGTMKQLDRERKGLLDNEKYVR